MRELREGLTSLEGLVREAAQAGGGWSAVNTGGPGGEQFIEEEVEADGGGGGHHGHGASKASSQASTPTPAAGDGTAAAAGAEAANGDGGGNDADGGGSGGHHHSGKKKKKIRRRVEPLPDFAAVAQTELGKLQGAFDAAQADYKGTCARPPRLPPRTAGPDGTHHFYATFNNPQFCSSLSTAPLPPIPLLAALVKWFKEDADLPADELFGTIHLFLQVRGRGTWASGAGAHP